MRRRRGAWSDATDVVAFVSLGVSFSSLSRNLDDKRDPSFVARHPLGGLEARTRGCRGYTPKNVLP